MILAELQVRDVRNLAQVDLEFDPRLNILLGANGQGKTNLLEAVYFLSTQRPLRGTRLRELVREGQAGCELRGVLRGELTTRLNLRVTGGRRVARIGEKVERSVSRWSACMPVVAFTPDDLSIIKGSPSERRRWLDRATFSRFPGHLDETRAYQRAVAGRNRLLKQERLVSDDEIAGFEAVIAGHGAKLLLARLRVLAELREPAARKLSEIAGSSAQMKIKYQSSLFQDAGTEQAGEPLLEEEVLRVLLEQGLAEHRKEDRARRRTSCGPHTDDLVFEHEGHNLRSFGSQGQQRSLILALKIAEIENLQATLGRSPLLLLDDVMSELDPARSQQLTEALQHFTGQVILTTTALHHTPLAEGTEGRIFELNGGRIGPQKQL